MAIEEIYPTGDPAVDVRNIQAAVDDAHVHIVRLMKSDAAEFDFGGDDVDHSVTVLRDVSIEGDDAPIRQWQAPAPAAWSAGVAPGGGTTIRGGRTVFKIGVREGPDPANPASTVTTVVPVRVTIQNIRFDGFYRSAIRMYGSHGASAIVGCSFDNYRQSTVGDLQPQGAFPIVVDNRADPTMITGSFRIANNYFAGATPTAGSTLNNVSHVSHCDLDLTVEHNRIEDAYLAGFAVYGNSGHTAIKENHITKDSSYARPAAGIDEGAAIAFGVLSRRRDGPVVIEGNTIDVGALDSHAVLVYRRDVDPPSSTTVRDNVITMAPGASFPRRSAVSLTGLAGVEATCDGNTISNRGGSVGVGCAPYGIFVSTRIPFKTTTATVPDQARWRLKIRDNRLHGFVATRAQVWVEPVESAAGPPPGQQPGPELKDNVLGPVDPAVANGDDPWTTGGLPGLNVVSVVFWQGREGSIRNNTFPGQTLGWSQNAHVGCLYLGASAVENDVTYETVSPFAQVAGQYDTNQIFEANLGLNDIRPH
jgi:hypothetical protein